MASAEDILSREEIAALLHAAAPEETAPLVESFDFAADDHQFRVALQRFDAIAWNFAVRLQNTLSMALRRSVDVSVRPALGHSSDAAALATLGQVSTGCLASADPMGPVWIAVDSSWVNRMLDAYYGGTGKASNGDYADSPAAAGMLRRFMEWIQADLNAVWTSSSHSALTIGDPHPRKAATSAGSGAQRVVLQPFSVRMEGQESELALIIPLSLLVGVEALANGHDAERESNWQRAMGRALWETPLTLTAYLAQIRLTVGELLALRSGDILPLEEPNRVAIYLEDRPLMAGETGIRNGRKVVRLAHRDVSRNETVMGAKA